jgi:hypothetical protein
MVETTAYQSSSILERSSTLTLMVVLQTNAGTTLACFRAVKLRRVYHAQALTSHLNHSATTTCKSTRPSPHAPQGRLSLQFPFFYDSARFSQANRAFAYIKNSLSLPPRAVAFLSL